jgi:hypothetical protein
MSVNRKSAMSVATAASGKAGSATRRRTGSRSNLASNADDRCIGRVVAPGPNISSAVGNAKAALTGAIDTRHARRQSAVPAPPATKAFIQNAQTRASVLPPASKEPTGSTCKQVIGPCQLSARNDRNDCFRGTIAATEPIPLRERAVRSTIRRSRRW